MQLVSGSDSAHRGTMCLLGFHSKIKKAASNRQECFQLSHSFFETARPCNLDILWCWPIILHCIDCLSLFRSIGQPSRVQRFICCSGASVGVGVLGNGDSMRENTVGGKNASAAGDYWGYVIHAIRRVRFDCRGLLLWEGGPVKEVCSSIV